MMFQKGFSKIVLILIIAAIAGAVWYFGLAKEIPFLSRFLTKDETADWKTYSNQYYSIKVPADWKEQENIIGAGLDNRLVGYTYGSYINLDCFVTPVEQCDPNAPPHVNLTIFVYNSGQKEKYNFQDRYYFDSPTYSYSIFVDYNSMADFLTDKDASEDYEKFRNNNKVIVDQILSTFRFIE